MAVAVALAASPALALVTKPGPGPERGIDISAYQDANGPINWRELAGHGIKFVAIKASEANYYTNPQYLPDARAASRAGLAVLAYAFANPDRAGGAATASFAVRAAHYRRGHGALPLVVDLENDPYSVSDCYWFGQSRMIAWIARFTTRARALTGSWPILYTTNAWWRECTGSTGRFRRDPLWLAEYNGGRPLAPSPWTRWSFWQYSEEGYLPGIGWTDLDYFQSASGLPSLHPASDQKPKPKATHKKHKPKHKKPQHKHKHKRKAEPQAETEEAIQGHPEGQALTRSKSSIPHAFGPRQLIGSAGDSAQAWPRYRRKHPHRRRRARARGCDAGSGRRAGGNRGHHAGVVCPGHRRVVGERLVDQLGGRGRVGALRLGQGDRGRLLHRP